MYNQFPMNISETHSLILVAAREMKAVRDPVMIIPIHSHVSDAPTARNVSNVEWERERKLCAGFLGGKCSFQRIKAPVASQSNDDTALKPPMDSAHVQMFRL
jgi:hypothetical protein